MGNTQTMIFASILALLRYKIGDLPVDFLKNQPNKRYAILLMAIWAFYTMLKHNGMLSKKSLKGQHVFISGGGMGIGRQMAMKLAKMGCKVTLADINMEAAEKTQQEIQKFNPEVCVVKCDVSSVDSVNSAANECQQKLGPVDVLINNAGIVTGKKLLDNSERGIVKTFEVNSISHSYTVRAFLPGMIQRDKGHIVTIASIAGHLGVAGLSDYCGSKFAAVGFDESLRMELKSQNSKVKTTCICPYYINTGMFDGIKTSFLMNILAPILSEQYAANRIINGIRQNEAMVVLPYSLYLIIFLKSFLPIWLYDTIANISGMNKSADQLTGGGRINQTK